MFEFVDEQYDEVERELAEFGLILEPGEDGNGFFVKSEDDEEEGKWYRDLGDVADLLVYLNERYVKED